MQFVCLINLLWFRHFAQMQLDRQTETGERGHCLAFCLSFNIRACARLFLYFGKFTVLSFWSNNSLTIKYMDSLINRLADFGPDLDTGLATASAPFWIYAVSFFVFAYFFFKENH